MIHLHSLPLLLSCAISAAGVLLSLEAAPAAWPQFRGPASRGIAEGARPPVHFGSSTNLLWKVAVPAGHSSPVLVNDRLIFNAADNKTLLTCAVDRKTGQELWRAEIPVEKLEKFHKVNSATPCTPVTDGERVYAYLPSFGVVAYDLEGKEKWRKPLPQPQTFMNQGSGASPLLAGELIVVEVPLANERQVLALRSSNGAVAWKAVEPMRSMGWATPVAWNDANGDCVGVLFGGQFSAYRLSDGKEAWSVTGLGAEACATPVVLKDRLLISSAGVQGEPANMTMPPAFDEALKRWDKNNDGRIARDEIPSDYLLTDRQSDGKGNMTLRSMIGMMGRSREQTFNRADWNELLEGVRGFRDGQMNRPNLMLVRLGGKGDVTKTHIDWQEQRGIPEVPSPLVYQERIYLIRNGGLLACRNLSDGKIIFDERIGAPGGYFASPLAADGRVYVASDRGVVTVVKASDKLEVLAQNDLAEPIFASPVAVDSALYVRTSQHLWAFGQ